MSKITFKTNTTTKKTDSEKPAAKESAATSAKPQITPKNAVKIAPKSTTAAKPATVAPKTTTQPQTEIKPKITPKTEPRQEIAAATEGVQMGIFPEEKKEEAPVQAPLPETFNKEKIVKYFKRHPNKKINTKVERFSPRLNEGLTQDQVETRFKQFLFNDTNKKYSRSYASIFIGNIFTFFNFLCLLAFFALLISRMQGFTNYLVIFITTANIVIGIIQEIRSKLSIDKLSILAANTVKVVRDGETMEIPVKELVLDDVIILELGNQVPADCILAEGSVEVNESLLTGESIAIKKSAGDILFAGSFISSGSGKFRVEKVGKETYLEKLTSKAKKYKRPNSELMNSTKLIIKCVSILIFPIAIATFFITRNIENPDLSNVIAGIFPQEVNFAIQRSFTVVIGMIPSGMLLLTSVALALGIVNLSKSNTLVQDMYSLEMLARVNVLCLDKTGTITDGRMRVNDSIILNTIGNYSLNDIMGSMLKELDNNNQTSIALYNHFGFSDKLIATAKIPFSSKRKLSAVTFGDVGTFAMGAPEFVLRPYPSKVERIVKQYAQMGLRVIVLAHSSNSITGDKLPTIMKPVAIISIADNVREDAIETIRWFKENDVNVKVISGDNPVTVSEVAKRAGISGAEQFISLDGLNEKEVENVANKYTVFGRVSPEQKAILVRAMKSAGNTVAMTGDGVNDILALKEADCAISVASGSEAARNVSHIVLMDNNFNSMPKVVAEGRRVINNIQNSSSLYLMKTLFTAMLALICIALNMPYIFTPSNMLLLEVAIIAIPSTALSLQPNKERVQGKFISHVISGSVAGAVLMIGAVMSIYLIYYVNHFLMMQSEFDNYYIAMAMIAMTFSGYVMVFRVCQPMNWYRVILCLSVLAVCLLGYTVPFVPTMLYADWNSLEWNYGQLLVIVVIIEAAFPVSDWLLKLMHFIMPTTADKKPKEERNPAIKAA